MQTVTVDATNLINTKKDKIDEILHILIQKTIICYYKKKGFQKILAKKKLNKKDQQKRSKFGRKQ